MDLQVGIFADLLAEQRERIAVERRSSLENPQSPLSYPAEWLLDIFNGGRTDSGIRVSELTALQCATFLACVDLVAGTIAALPKHVFERKIVANGRASHRIAYEHDYEDLIHLEPNDEMSRFVFDKAGMAHVLAWGNSYAEIQRDAGNAATALWPRNPYKTRPHRLVAPVRLDPVEWRPFPVNLKAGDLVYRTTDGIDDMDTSDTSAERQRDRIIPKEDMLHISGLALDGRIGQDVVWLARNVLGLALATEKFGAKYFANFARPSGILTTPALSDAQKTQAKQSWLEAQGGENAHRIAVMGPGFDFKPISINPVDSQLVESGQAQDIKICSILHVPPHMVGVGRVTSRSNTEQQAQEFISYTLSPWIMAIKQENKRKLFPNPGIGRGATNRFFIDFDLTDLQRADAAAREAFYHGGRQDAYLNTNDIRAFEKLNPIEEAWAEDYWMPVNMTLAETPLDPNHQDGDGDGKKSADGETEPGGDDDQVTGRYVRRYSRLFSDAFQRVVSRDKRDLRLVQAAFGPVLFSIRDGFFDLAASQMRVRSKPGAESDEFVAGYMAALTRRAEAWRSETAGGAVERELRRAIRALRVAAWREAASLKAKSMVETTEGVEDDNAD